ncbi:hypothetical protein FEM48_Zijuj12G0145900 [Ziziphus jujuba var. spinosa]|uniref:AP complex mu/sigma subunit domain-containing protein n=1 Tax=Ziziphus jujuba var. spinosa TaxID=714518 RepID=A0A978UDW8_ZIZJJ|nr:hypothetical protein FEM48_Zijuj12G0145900 [Ziziphus jujuba var. spinosa]
MDESYALEFTPGQVKFFDFLQKWVKFLCGSEEPGSHVCGLLIAVLWVMGVCSFVEHRNYKIVYWRYASLFFLVGVDNESFSSSLISSKLANSKRRNSSPFDIFSLIIYLQNELAILEFIRLLVEIMDRHFGNVFQCEIDIMFHLEKSHFMLEEMVMNGVYC